MPVTSDEAKARVLEQLPPGASDLYDLSPGSDPDKFFSALGDCFKAYGFDQVDALRREQNLLTMVERVPDWEATLGLSRTFVALEGDTDSRRGQVLGKLRQSGAAVPSNILAIVAAMLQVDASKLTLIETSRSALTTANEYNLVPPFTTIPAATSATWSVYIGENAPISDAGLFIFYKVSHPSPSDLSFTLKNPINHSFSPIGPGLTIDNVQHCIADPTKAGDSMEGFWEVHVVNTGGSTGTITLMSLFAEGIGRDLTTGAEGLGAAIFDWSVAVKPTDIPASAVIDFAAVRAVLNQIKPAHTRCGLVFYMSDGTLCALCDDTYAIADGCVCC